jgi:hypothetical protein
VCVCVRNGSGQYAHPLLRQQSLYGPGATARELTSHTPRVFSRPHAGNIIDLSAFNGQADTLAVRSHIQHCLLHSPS